MDHTSTRRNPATRRLATALMFLGVGALIGAGVLFALTSAGILDSGGSYSGPGTVTGFGSLDLASLSPTATPAAAPSDAPIVRIVIPKVEIDAPIVVKSVDANGAMESPDGPWDVAWYDFSAKPGFGSNAVFSGHVDYVSVGPAVFWGLKDLAQGDIIEVRLEDSTVYQYRVAVLETIDAAAADLGRILGGTSQDVVTLITCAGTFNQATREYDQRLIVRAERVPEAAEAGRP